MLEARLVNLSVEITVESRRRGREAAVLETGN
jgi:hypothetical protein